ncbi:MAG TPA: AarF/UbiB family protein [Gemmataceae bacterium]
MTTSDWTPPRPPQERPRARRKQVLACLKAFGLRPRRRPAAVPAGRRLRAALEQLGPVHAAFGRYLASRADLLTAAIRQELDGLAGGPPPVPPDAVRGLIDAELGRPLGEWFSAFDPEPCERGLLVQAHRAWLRSGEPVVVTVAPPGRSEDMAPDLATLSLFREVLAGETEAGLTLDTAVTDFRRAVQDQADLPRQARAWLAAAEDAAEDESLYVPRVHAELCAPRVLTREWVPGRPLGDVAAARPDLAGRLCAAWLRQVLFDRSFPADAGPGDVVVLPDGRVAFAGGTAVVPASARGAVRDYLTAAAAGDPDAACGHLFRLMDGGLPPARADEVRRRFRQAVPARGAGAADGLGEVLLLHWRLALAEGCRPPAYLTRLFRAAFLVHAAAARLAPDEDALGDGLEAVRMTAAVGRLGELMSPGQVIRTLERYVPALHDLPRRLDEALTVLAEGNARLSVRLHETADGHRQKNAAATTAALLLALLAVGLLGYHLARAGVIGESAAQTGGVLVLAAGVAVLGRITAGR